ncbi:MAG: SUMF1/EgtB/PvdO family nonheme iron enzyme [Planctomycetes bacterium]|nr:SUMF1/EgtB/PvdO family nonheme iron enzyme [Planctomycetota bacterium]
MVIPSRSSPSWPGSDWNRPRPGREAAEVPRELEAVCLKALAWASLDRYPSTAAMAADLEAWLAGRSVSVLAAPMPVRVVRWYSRHRFAATVCAAIVLAALVAGVLGDHASRLADSRRESAVEEEQGAARESLAATQVEAARELDRARFTFRAYRDARDAWIEAWRKEDEVLASRPPLPRPNRGETLAQFAARTEIALRDSREPLRAIRSVIASRCGDATEPNSSAARAFARDETRDRWLVALGIATRLFDQVRLARDASGLAWRPQDGPGPEKFLAELAALTLQTSLDEALDWDAAHPCRAPSAEDPAQDESEGLPEPWQEVNGTLDRARSFGEDPALRDLLDRATSLAGGRTAVHVGPPPPGTWAQLECGSRPVPAAGADWELPPGFHVLFVAKGDPLPGLFEKGEGMPPEYIDHLFETQGEPIVRQVFLVERGKPLEVEVRHPGEIPPGTIWVSCSEHFTAGNEPDDLPRHRARVPDFFIQEKEVSLGEYVEFLRNVAASGDREFLEAVRPRIRSDDGIHPIVDDSFAITRQGIDPKCPVPGISYLAAQAYGRWKTEHDSAGHLWRLPTEDEWEVAAGGPLGSVYPWGKSFAWKRARSQETRGKEYWAKVDDYKDGRSFFGAWQMSGNVSELMASPFDSLHVVIRGGSWFDDFHGVRVASREAATPSSWANQVGFRLVCEPTRKAR